MNREYPRSRIKFDESVQRLKREDPKSVSVKTPRKEYILRCEKSKDMDEWFKLFNDGLQAKYLTGSMINRMTKYSTKPAKLPKQGSSQSNSSISSPKSNSGLASLLGRVQQHQKEKGKRNSGSSDKGNSKRNSGPQKVRFAHSFDEMDDIDEIVGTLTLDDDEINAAISPVLKTQLSTPGTPNSQSRSHSFSPSHSLRGGISEEDILTVIGPHPG